MQGESLGWVPEPGTDSIGVETPHANPLCQKELILIEKNEMVSIFLVMSLFPQSRIKNEDHFSCPGFFQGTESSDTNNRQHDPLVLVLLLRVLAQMY